MQSTSSELLRRLLFFTTIVWSFHFRDVSAQQSQKQPHSTFPYNQADFVQLATEHQYRPINAGIDLRQVHTYSLMSALVKLEIRLGLDNTTLRAPYLNTTTDRKSIVIRTGLIGYPIGAGAWLTAMYNFQTTTNTPVGIGAQTWWQWRHPINDNNDNSYQAGIAAHTQFTPTPGMSVGFHVGMVVQKLQAQDPLTISPFASSSFNYYLDGVGLQTGLEVSATFSTRGSPTHVRGTYSFGVAIPCRRFVQITPMIMGTVSNSVSGHYAPDWAVGTGLRINHCPKSDQLSMNPTPQPTTTTSATTTSATTTSATTTSATTTSAATTSATTTSATTTSAATESNQLNSLLLTMSETCNKDNLESVDVASMFTKISQRLKQSTNPSMRKWGKEVLNVARRRLTSHNNKINQHISICKCAHALLSNVSLQKQILTNPTQPQITYDIINEMLIQTATKYDIFWDGRVNDMPNFVKVVSTLLVAQKYGNNKKNNDITAAAQRVFDALVVPDWKIKFVYKRGPKAISGTRCENRTINVTQTSETALDEQMYGTEQFKHFIHEMAHLMYCHELAQLNKNEKDYALLTELDAFIVETIVEKAASGQMPTRADLCEKINSMMFQENSVYAPLWQSNNLLSEVDQQFRSFIDKLYDLKDACKSVPCLVREARCVTSSPVQVDAARLWQDLRLPVQSSWIPTADVCPTEIKPCPAPTEIKPCPAPPKSSQYPAPL